MTEPVTLELLDEAHQGTRGELLRRGGALVAGGLLIGGLPQVALGKPSAKQDAAILNFALTLEYLESAFYVDAVNRGVLSGAALTFATTVRDHELAHVQALRQALGSAAVAKPAFDFKGTTSDPAKFVATAMLLEDTGVAAYNGQGARLRRRTLPTAASIVSVEARHAAWIRRIAAGPGYDGGKQTMPAPVAFDPALSKRKVEAAVAATGFIAG
jgi:hypothetical protein